MPNPEIFFLFWITSKIALPMNGITLGDKRKKLKGKLEKPEAISQNKPFIHTISIRNFKFII